MSRVILGLLLSMLGCFAVAARAHASSGSFDFTAKKVEQGQWQPHLASQGRVIAEREVALSVPFAVLINTVPVYGDQSVKKGQVLAKIDPTPVIGLLSDLKTAYQRLELARRRLSNNNQRFHEKLATRDDVIQAQEALNIAKSDLNNSWLATNNVLLLLGDTVSESTLHKQLEENAVDVIAQQHSVIRAPFDGVIAQRMVGPGTHLAGGQPLFVLDDMSHVYVSSLVSPDRVDQWKAGTAYAKTNNGKVKLSLLSKVPSIDAATGLVNLKFQADNPQGEFLDGQWVDVILDSNPLLVLWVPESAVVERNGRTYCVRRIDKTYESVEVKVGSAANGRIPVLSGLQAGDKVVVQNAYLLLYRDLKDIMKRAAD